MLRGFLQNVLMRIKLLLPPTVLSTDIVRIKVKTGFFMSLILWSVFNFNKGFHLPFCNIFSTSLILDLCVPDITNEVNYRQAENHQKNVNLKIAEL